MIHYWYSNLFYCVFKLAKDFNYEQLYIVIFVPEQLLLQLNIQRLAVEKDELWKQKFFDHILCCCISSCSVLEKDPVGSKALERNICVSNSKIKAEKEQPDHEVRLQ